MIGPRLPRTAGCAVILGVLLGAVPGSVWDGLARTSAANPARNCRVAIGMGGFRVVSAGLKTLDACHLRRDRGQFVGDCNVLATGGSSFARAQTRAEGMISNRCPAGNAVLENYPGGVIADVFPPLKELLERSGSEVQGAPDITGDVRTRSARSRCHQAIGKGRSAIVNEIVKHSTACQRKIDAKATLFGPLDARCVVSTPGSLARTRSAITRACNGVSAAEVGSCASLPECVLDEATSSGQALARVIFGATAMPTTTTVPTVPTTTASTAALPTSTTTTTFPPVCGNGVVEGGEQCDDGNDVSNDGCTNCTIDGAPCGADGVDVTVALVFDPLLVDLGGLIVNLGYARAGVSILGSGDAPSVLDRVQDLSGKNLAVFNDQDTNGDAIDDNLVDLYTSTQAIAPGPFESVRFDCTAGASVQPRDFDCGVAGPSDTLGNPLHLSRELLDCKVTRVASAGAVPTTSTTTTSTTTTSSTTTTTIPHTCGNGITEGPAETCDDGNTVDESTMHTLPPDACPANCRIEACTSTTGTVSVSVNFASAASIAGYTVFVDYPEGKVVIPGTGQPGTGIITNDPTASATANDLDYGVLVVAGGLSAIRPSRLFTINFTPCTGPAPVASEFRCTVHDASDPGGNTVPMTCSVSIP